MAQLIKLQDYVSRYEQDAFRYPSQYIRLKKQQWEKLKKAWETNSLHYEEFEWEEIEKKKTNLLNKVTGLFKKEKIEIQEEVEIKPNNSLQFAPLLSFRPDTEDELKQIFLDQLFNFQLKWASSTIYEKSNIHMKYYYDDKLHTFLQRFPDTFLLLYEPVLLLKKAPVEMEIILITPMEIWCITFLEEEKDAVFLGSTDRFWLKRSNKSERKVLNPMISLNRMTKIVQQILSHYQVDLPIKKAIVCRNGYIDFPEKPYDLSILEKREYPKWFEQMRNTRAPLKHMQLKAAKILLDYCQTASFKRMEWDEESLDPFEEENLN
ncbi:NERD domain-containing protein [Bacillus sp. FJAT-49736]|uniref:NERD domain-containing protein n=1 Tax=Bacillus sp. FJAT-49736 TaxID=2833582 RepID=UPI001BCA061A|nr:NERD domain-containing protein [Bacillus sp. FJAT-49736]MBS4173865.1 NERD domain-containing protein [Bacillus sp. FJAT-49736]